MSGKGLVIFLLLWWAAHGNGYCFGDLTNPGIAEGAKALAGFNEIRFPDYSNIFGANARELQSGFARR